MQRPQREMGLHLSSPRGLNFHATPLAPASAPVDPPTGRDTSGPSPLPRHLLWRTNGARTPVGATPTQTAPGGGTTPDGATTQHYLQATR